MTEQCCCARALSFPFWCAIRCAIGVQWRWDTAGLELFRHLRIGVHKTNNNYVDKLFVVYHLITVFSVCVTRTADAQLQSILARIDPSADFVTVVDTTTNLPVYNEYLLFMNIINDDCITI